MHELSIAQEIMNIIESERERHGFSQVNTVRIRAGALCGIDPHALEFGFEIVRENTCAAQAKLELDIEPLKLHCRACGQTADASHGPQDCPSCGSVDIRLDGTVDFDVVSLEVEQS